MTAVELQMLADSTGGHLIGQSVALQGLAIDSRAIKGRVNYLPRYAAPGSMDMNLRQKRCRPVRQHC